LAPLRSSGGGGGVTDLRWERSVNVGTEGDVVIASRAAFVRHSRSMPASGGCILPPKVGEGGGRLD
jgi:hypothetical protein